MSVRKRVTYEAKVFAVGSISAALAAIAKALSPKFGFSATIRRENPDGTESTEDSKQALDHLCDLTQQRSSLYVHFTKDGYSSGAPSISLSGFLQSYTVFYEAPDAAQLSTLIAEVEKHLQLSIHVPKPGAEEEEGYEDEWDAIDDLRRRVDALEKTDHKLTLFLSYRFDAKGRAYASEVRDLLEILEVNVITGDAFEPRIIQDKVRSHLEGLDAVVVILTKGKSSAWVRDELNRSDAAVIPLVEQGARFEKGLFGDIEYIPFAPGHIGDAFKKLVEGIRFLARSAPRKKKKRKAAQ
jgi:hypothetical protein